MSSRYLKLLEELKRTKAEPLHKDSRVLIVDGLNTFIRSFAASPVTNDDGLHIGGISGTLLSIGHAIKTVDPTRVIVVFDGKNGAKRRREVFPEYKANRKFKIRLNRSEDLSDDDGQLRQLRRLVEYMSHMPFSIVTAEGVEADDVIGYLAVEKFKEQCYIMSSDKDFLQLVDERVRIWSPTKKRLYYTPDIVEEYGVHPNNFVLYRALTGDKSDNIPGVDGLGLKTLLKLYPQFAEETQLSVDDIVNYAQTQPKSKMCVKLTQSKDLIERNLGLMQLSEAFIPTASKLKILDQVDNPNRLVKYKFQAMLFEDRMTTAIKNVDMWTREVLQKIDGYLLD